MASTSFSRETMRSASGKEMVEERASSTVTSATVKNLSRNRDSGTSSPLPSASTDVTAPVTLNDDSASRVEYVRRHTCTKEVIVTTEGDDEDGSLSDSNDSVISTCSSVDSVGTTELEQRDIYLGGSCMLRTSWRQKIVIPILEHNQITYHLPRLHESIYHHRNGIEFGDSDRCNADIPANLLEPSGSNDSGISVGGNKRSNCTRATNNKTSTVMSASSNSAHSTLRRNMFNEELLNSSKVLLFVITNETRSLAPMTLAAYCIGLGMRVVLCVQMLSNDCVIGDDKVSQLKFFIG